MLLVILYAAVSPLHHCSYFTFRSHQPRTYTPIVHPSAFELLIPRIAFYHNIQRFLRGIVTSFSITVSPPSPAWGLTSFPRFQNYIGRSLRVEHAPYAGSG